MLDQLKADLIRDEGVKLHPYRDTVGKLTIGVGRNLDDRGITNVEAYVLMNHDIAEVLESLEARLDWWHELSDGRKRALTNMAFNLGIQGLMGFKRMLAAMEAKEWEKAGAEALDSKWAGQVGKRAERIAKLIRRG